MIISVRGKRVKLPDFFIVGAAKSGTTSLYYYLVQHPQIFMPSEKEPAFFAYRELPPHYTIPGVRHDRRIRYKLEDYVKLFRTAKDGQVIGEGSTAYLYTYNLTIPHIKQIYGNKYKELKIIAILRNPIDRVFSHYFFISRAGGEPLPFADAIKPEVIERRIPEARGYDYTGYGMYYNQVKAYMEEFPHTRFYLFEDLKDNNLIIKDLFGFLDVDKDLNINTDIKANPSGIPKNRFLVKMLLRASIFKSFVLPKTKVKLATARDILLNRFLVKNELDVVLRKKLILIFRDDILKLQDLLKRDLSHWLEIKQNA